MQNEWITRRKKHPGWLVRLVPALFVASFLTGVPAARPSPEDASAAGIRVQVDPRVELMCIVCRLAGFKEYQDGQLPLYNQAVQEHFRNLGQHPALALARRLRQERGIGYDAPMSLALCLSSDGQFAPRLLLDPLPASLDERWTPALAQDFAKAVQSFAAASKFAEFWASQRTFYDQVESRLTDMLARQKLTAWFFRFFGSRPAARFVVVPGLLNGGGSYGPHVTLPDGTQEIYSILGIWQLDAQRLPVFPDELCFTIAHEFTHTFTNPWCNRHAPEMAQVLQQLYKPVKESMKSQAYGSWTTVFYETMVRAANVRFMAAVKGEAAAAAVAKNDAVRGFFWVGALADKLKEYEANRSQYPDLDAFAPQIAAFFREYTPKGVAAWKVSQRAAADKKKATLAQAKREGPRVVRLEPANGSRTVDPALKEIRVTFDRPMKNGAWAVVKLGRPIPPVTGSVHYDDTRTVLVIPVALEPDTQYEFGLNSDLYLAFCSEKGIPLYPMAVKFKTGPKKP